METEKMNNVVECCCCGGTIDENASTSARTEAKNGAGQGRAGVSLWSSPLQVTASCSITLHHMATTLGCFKYPKCTENETMVCEKCVSKLVNAYCFRKMCLHSEKRAQKTTHATEESDDALSRRRKKERTKKHSKHSTISKDKNKKSKNKYTRCSIDIVKKIVTDCLKDQGILKERNLTPPDILSPLSALTLQDE